MTDKDDSQERTEQATPKHREDMRKKGHVLRSKEWSTLLVVLSSACMLIFFEDSFVSHFEKITKQSFVLSRNALFSEDILFVVLMSGLKSGIVMLLPVFAGVFFAVVAGNLALGGSTFSAHALTPKFDRLNPFSGLKRIFSARALMELLKACIKVTAILAVAYFVISYQWERIFNLVGKNHLLAMHESVSILNRSLVLFAMTLIVVSVIDIPYEVYRYLKEMRMTKQQVRDEFKSTEGNPEIKGRVRQLQRQMSKRRMMKRVAEADAVLVNPEHYSIAIIYDRATMRAPIVVAKGVELIAFKIREKAKEHAVPIIEAPPLARALYYSTELEEPIPAGLYVAVAQVLAYVYQLKRFEKGEVYEKPKLKDLPIPDDLKR